jgi:hypothetical protein
VLVVVGRRRKKRSLVHLGMTSLDVFWDSHSSETRCGADPPLSMPRGVGTARPWEGCRGRAALLLHVASVEKQSWWRLVEVSTALKAGPKQDSFYMLQGQALQLLVLPLGTDDKMCSSCESSSAVFQPRAARPPAAPCLRGLR